jgi:hypothetical protein
MKNKPVQHECKQRYPEDQTKTEEKPRNFGRSVVHPGNWHNDIAHHRDEPGRVDMLDLQRRSLHPRG